MSDSLLMKQCFVMDDPSQNTSESTRSIAAQSCKFLGLMLTCAGALAVIRLLGTQEENQRWFYALLMPLGMVTWFIGFWLSLDRAKSPQSHAEARPDEQGGSSKP
ncbi:MAG: hypothetical protein IT444_07630 [Phycisphaeraceae bacterium]|nr:hypothetical protein [Phycisphaeraceae bacterium]